jgi:hypothetical protein
VALAGKWPELFTPPALTYGTSFHGRWVWSQLNRFADAGIKGHAAGMVIVYDLSPAMAFGLAQRSVYTENGRAGTGRDLRQLSDADARSRERREGARGREGREDGDTYAARALSARHGKAILASLPGENYGTPQDEQVLLPTHTDAMSLIEENGGLGMLGSCRTSTDVPKSERARTLIFYFDCRHFMPGAEASWPSTTTTRSSGTS